MAGAVFDERISGMARGGSVIAGAEGVAVVNVEGVKKGQKRRHRTLPPPAGSVCCHPTAWIDAFTWRQQECGGAQIHRRSRMHTHTNTREHTHTHTHTVFIGVWKQSQ